MTGTLKFFPHPLTRLEDWIQHNYGPSVQPQPALHRPASATLRLSQLFRLAWFHSSNYLLFLSS